MIDLQCKVRPSTWWREWVFFFLLDTQFFLLTIWQNREFSLALDYHSARLKSIKRQKQKKQQKKSFALLKKKKKVLKKKVL